ncbi:cysteine-rich venom protein VAR10-like [Anneissia japonica]|uniref:cysteine-rich venom protein VAR10-like n=1 Tax=Anneissia japonica TaxID=1529436 RepID=UPI0014254EEE|nr:cysteine-rich venom protein VAR10-like [Anneissia japonica]
MCRMDVAVFLITLCVVLQDTLGQEDLSENALAQEERSEQWFQPRQNQQILNTINSLRRIAASKVGEGVTASNMKKLKWDSILEEEAKLLTSCEQLLNNDESEASFMELTSSSTSLFEVWEWVDAAATRGVLSIKNTVATTMDEMFSEVFSEGDNFNFFTRRCNKGLNCSRYLQLTWADADQVGCSINSKCHYDANVHYLSCVFNIEAKVLEEPFRIGTECSRCPDSAPFCEAGLCVSSCEQSKDSTCFCPKTCVHKGIGSGVLDKTSCTCECTYGTGTDCQDVCENIQLYENYDYCAEINTEEHCENDKFLQLLFCKENCDYGCKKSPYVVEMIEASVLKK